MRHCNYIIKYSELYEYCVSTPVDIKDDHDLQNYIFAYIVYLYIYALGEFGCSFSVFVYVYIMISYHNQISLLK